jgi:hypothetical protein
MNRRRNESRTSGFPILALIFGAVIITGGGVLHGFYKNSQVKITREIDAIERSIEHQRLEIRTTEMRMDQLLNRFVIRKQLEQNGSTLRPLSLAFVEEIDPAPTNRRSVASAAP